jgi:hypothetical protein
VAVAKMTVSIVVFALGIYVANFVQLGDYTLREHMVRIGNTSEVHELGEGIVARLSTTKSAVKTRIAARLHREE